MRKKGLPFAQEPSTLKRSLQRFAYTKWSTLYRIRSPEYSISERMKRRVVTIAWTLFDREDKPFRENKREILKGQPRECSTTACRSRAMSEEDERKSHTDPRPPHTCRGLRCAGAPTTHVITYKVVIRGTNPDCGLRLRCGLQSTQAGAVT